jgi:small subunit ribosomal protein S16
MLVVRLQRTGRKNIPAFRLVVTENSAPIKGKVQEYLGHYLPMRTPHEFVFKKERIEHWLKVGAKPSDTVARLLKREGVEGLEKYILKYTKKKKRKGTEEKSNAAAAPKTEDKRAEEKAEDAAKSAPAGKKEEEN